MDFKEKQITVVKEWCKKKIQKEKDEKTAVRIAILLTTAINTIIGIFLFSINLWLGCIFLGVFFFGQIKNINDKMAKEKECDENINSLSFIANYISSFSCSITDYYYSLKRTNSLGFEVDPKKVNAFINELKDILR